MNAYNLLKLLINGQIEGIEFKDINNNYQNITFNRANIGLYADGTKIKLTKEFLDWTQWFLVKNNQTFLEAFTQASNPNNTQPHNIFSIHQEIRENNYIENQYDEVVEGRTLSDFKFDVVNFYTLKNIVEDKSWFAYVWDYENQIKLRSGVSTPSLPYPQKSYDFIDIISNQNLINYQQYIKQWNTDRKIYPVYEDGFRDASNGQHVQLDATFITEGKWYLAETFTGNGYNPPVDPEPPVDPPFTEGSGDMNITQALATIDWNTQEMVYRIGGTYEFILKNKEDYEDNRISSYMTHVDKINFEDVLINQSWSIRTKTV